MGGDRDGAALMGHRGRPGPFVGILPAGTGRVGVLPWVTRSMPPRPGAAEEPLAFAAAHLLIRGVFAGFD